MKKTAVALVLAALLAATTNPALAGCGGSHGKAYRAAQGAKKPVAKSPAAVEATSAPAPTSIATETSVSSNSTEL
jgi:hypothetical protein